MKRILFSKLNALLAAALLASSAQAAIVDFEEFGSTGSVPLMLSTTFSGANTTPMSRQRLESVDGMGNPVDSFGDTGGITFSGGVLLENPTETGTMFPDVAGVAVGSVLYGTANAPSSGAQPSPLLEQTITVSIAESEDVTSVQGILINGLATTMDTDLAEYFVSYYSGDTLLNAGSTSIGTLPSNQEFGASLFSFDTMSLAGALMGSLITKIEITSFGVDFPGGTSNACTGTGVAGCEYDFLIDALSFNETLQPVPVPAALPLFLSALLGGWVFARPRKPSESIH